MTDQSAADKEHEPTEHKLAEARKRGEIVRSTDVNGAAVYAGFLAVALGLGVTNLANFGATAKGLLDRADSLGAVFLRGGTGPAAGALAGLVLSVIPWFLGPMVFVIAALAVQRAVVLSPEKLLPKLQRIDPIANAGQKFGRDGLFEFLKSFAKLLIIAIVLTVFLLDRMSRILIAQSLAPALATAELLTLIVEFLIWVVVIATVIAAGDYLWQSAQHLRRNRMSRQELMDEFKQSEGDPQLKGQRRRRAIEIATNKMLADVPKADVVIVNPTHYAVALQWTRGGGQAPVCIAKGADEIAARIREAATGAGVPLHSDPPTARALHATVEIGQEIRPEHYLAVAAAIRFAERMRQRARERRGG